MADELRVTLEIGPHGKRVVAVAPDWPGLERGAKTGEAAITSRSQGDSRAGRAPVVAYWRGG